MRATILTILLILLANGKLARADALPDPATIQFFESEIRPLLVEDCGKCHGSDASKIKGGLNILSHADFLRGGDNGPAVDPKNPVGSLFLKMVNYVDDDHQMPPKKKLSAAKIELLTRWVKMGAPWAPSGLETPVAETPREDPKNYWAYKKPERLMPPSVHDAAWARSPVDTFVLSRLEANGLHPNAPASKIALIRRATYDLIGLPPSASQVAAFVADESPNAFEKVVDRLLASPQYGEQWGRHWLDLVGYAETNGYERDSDKPHAWRFRDYVVNSFNENEPYDQFLTEQLAGDQLPRPTPESIIATGYYRLGIWDDEPADRELAAYDTLDTMVATTSQVMLGMSMNCARCHNHKRDPILQDDYYKLVAFFHSIKPMDAAGPNIEVIIHHDPAGEAARAAHVAALKAKIKPFEVTLHEKLEVTAGADVGADNFVPLVKERGAQLLGPEAFGQYKKLKTELRSIETDPLPGDNALAVTENPSPINTFVLARGNPQSKGKVVEPGFPSVLGFTDPKFDGSTAGRRLALAKWITSRDNPLTARVMVNRLWQYHFGRGIVPTPNDFGKLGQLPTHPELLDWLATEFMARNWDVKSMHKLLMLSSAYQMSSADDSSGLGKDPQNNLFWRFNMRRLTAEEIRDSILSVNGTLNLQAGGPSVFPPMPEEVLATSSRPLEVWSHSPPDQAARRSIYVKVKRSLLFPILSTYDLADTDASTAVRFTTTVPTQALTMLNSAFANEQANIFAQKLEGSSPERPRQVSLALATVAQHAPSTEDVARGVDFIHDLETTHHLSPHNALSAFCLLSLNLNEFVYLD